MANELKSYIDKYIFNNESSVHIGEVGNEESQAVVEDGEDSRTDVVISKLRAQNVSKLADKNTKYKDKKVLKNKLSSENKNSSSYDPELAKYFLSDEIGLTDEESSFDKSKGINEISEYSDEDDGDNDSVEDEESEFETEEDHSDDQEDHDDKTLKHPTIQTFSEESDNYRRHKQKALAVKQQFNLSDSIFEMRIGLQKALSNSNRLPQHDCFKVFISKDPNYKKSLQKARSEAKKLLAQLILLQDEFLGNNPQTKNILQASSFESIFGSDTMKEDEEVNGHRKSKKRKVEQFEDILSKRHEAFIPFRNDTLTQWHERSQTLRSNNSNSNFSGFESSAVKQLEDILSNDEQLLKRTQLVSVERGNQSEILGKELKDGDNSTNYDPEIFDDTDFYSQQLSYVLKSKMSSTDGSGSNMAQSLANVLALRRRTKKKVIPRSSKSRTLRYEVMTLMQNYLAPCKFPTLSEDASDKLFTSLFGQSHTDDKKLQENKIS